MKPIRTQRLIIRGFEKEYAEALYEYLSDEEVVRFEPYGVFDRRQAELEALRRGADGRFSAVCLKGGPLIGNLYLAQTEEGVWELGYVFNRAYWGCGYATEAARAAVTRMFCERPEARKLVAMCNPENPRSWRLMERLGMRRVKRLERNGWFKKDKDGNPIWFDTYVYEISREAFLSANPIAD